jgi:hypothetical protein
MRTLQIEPTDFTPKVYFNAGDQLFEISGFSRPEDVIGFYAPVIDWIKEFSIKLIEAKRDKVQFTKTLCFAFRLTYFNSSSAKVLLQILEKIKELDSHNIPVRVEWYYDEGDDQILEDGEDLASAVDMKFDYTEIKS